MTNKIITQAITLGFDFEQFDDETTVEEITNAMMEFFFENSEKLEQIEDECEVDGHGFRQSVTYADYQSSGQIVDFTSHSFKAPGTKVFHSSFIMEQDGIMKNMNLYYLVGETDDNVPAGYYFDYKTNRHEIIES